MSFLYLSTLWRHRISFIFYFFPKLVKCLLTIRSSKMKVWILLVDWSQIFFGVSIVFKVFHLFFDKHLISSLVLFILVFLYIELSHSLHLWIHCILSLIYIFQILLKHIFKFKVKVFSFNKRFTFCVIQNFLCFWWSYCFVLKIGHSLKISHDIHHHSWLLFLSNLF